MKKIIGIIACLAVVAAIGAYFFLIPGVEKQQVAQVEAFINQLPGDLKAESVSAQSFGKQVEILGLKGTTTGLNGMDMAVDVKRITIKGINLTPGSGVVDLVDELAFEDLKISTNMGDSLEIPTTAVQKFKDLTIKGLRGDYDALRSAIAADSRADIIDCLATKYSATQVSANEYASQAESFLGLISMDVKAFSSKNVSLLKNGYTAFDDLALSVFGVESVRIGNLTIEACQIPNVYPVLWGLQEPDTMTGIIDSVFDAEEKDAFFVKGLVLNDMTINMMLPEPVSIAKLDFEFSLFKNNNTFKHSINGLRMPQSVYQNFGSEFAQFANLYNKPLNIDAAIDVGIRGKDDNPSTLTVKRIFIEEKALAEVDFSFTALVNNSLRNMSQLQQDTALTKARLRLEDRNLIDLVVKSEFANLEGADLPEGVNSPDALRTFIANQCTKNIGEEGLPKSMAKALAGVAELLKAPGVLTMAFDDESGTPIDIGLGGLDQFPFEKLEVEYVPAQSAGAIDPLQQR